MPNREHKICGGGIEKEPTKQSNPAKMPGSLYISFSFRGALIVFSSEELKTPLDRVNNSASAASKH